MTQATSPLRLLALVVLFVEVFSAVRGFAVLQSTPPPAQQQQQAPFLTVSWLGIFPDIRHSRQWSPSPPAHNPAAPLFCKFVVSRSGEAYYPPL